MFFDNISVLDELSYWGNYCDWANLGKIAFRSNMHFDVLPFINVVISTIIVAIIVGILPKYNPAKHSGTVLISMLI